MAINLFFNYYKSKERQHEIDLCLLKNKQVFDNVIIVEGRPTFSELFALTKDYPNDINCFCNSDIYFESTKLLSNINDNECYALSRWNIKKGRPQLFDVNFSQDSWVFKGEVKVKADFTMGIRGCDNRLAYEIKASGYKISNPSKSIVTVHVHASNRGNLNPNEETIPEPYLTLQPTKL